MWEASTTPDLLKRWLLGPPGWTMTACEMNLRVGGVYRYEWRKDDGTVMRMGGVLREVVKSGASTGMETGYARLAEPPAATQAGGGQYPDIHEAIEENSMQKITPFLWFDGNAEEATSFYLSIFKNSKLLSVMPGPGGKAMGTTFQLEGQEFHTLNGGPKYSFTPAISLFVNCETQQEVDELWETLLAEGGRADRCGWLQDKYGLSWQIIPTALGRLLGDKDRAKASKVMEAMMQMVKIDIAGLQRAYDQV